MNETIGDKIRKLRNQLKLNQECFVEVLDINRAYLSMIEANKKKPGRELLIKLSKKFNVTLDWLLSDHHYQDSASIRSKDEAQLLYAFRNMPEDEAKMHLQLMLNRINNYKKFKMTETIGDRIKKIRQENGMKQVDFAACLDITRSYLSGIETNKTKPGRELLIKLSKEFHISLDWLLSDHHYQNTASIRNEDEAQLLYAFRNLPKDEAQTHLQLMLQRADKTLNKG